VDKLENNPSKIGAFFLGVDGGTTKTLALVADGNGNILGASRQPGSNWTGEDVEIPMAIVIEAALQAQQQAGISPSQVQIAMFTLAGADWVEDHLRRQAALEKANLAQKVIVKNDSFGGLRAGTSKPYGIVIAAGTGVNAAAIAPDGREWAFGYYETYGGAGSMAEEAFVAVLRAEDGRGQPTLLTSLVLDRLGFSSVEAMLRASVARKIEPGRFYTLCPLVFKAALCGDEVACEIVVKQGLALAEYANALIRRFDMQALEFDVVLAGSVFKGEGPLLIDTLTQAIHRQAPRARITLQRFEPVVGSLLLAYDAAGIPETEMLIANLKHTMPAPAFFSTLQGA